MSYKSAYRHLYIFPIWLSFFVMVSYGQDIVDFKNQIPASKYEELILKEQNAYEERNILRKASQLTDLASECVRLSDELGKRIYVKALEANIQTENDSMIARGWLRSSLPYINTGEYEEGETRLDKALEYYFEVKDSAEIAHCFRLKGYMERLKGRYYVALEHLHYAQSVQEKIMPLSQMWDVTNRLMINYILLSDYESALSYGENFLESARNAETKPKGYYTVLINTGKALFNNGNYSKARTYINEALPIWMETKYPKFLAESYSTLYEIAFQEGDYELAKSYADSNLLYSSQFNSPRMMSNAHLGIYNVLDRVNQKSNQQFHIKSAYDNAVESNHKRTMLNAAEVFAHFESSQSNYKRAFQYQSLADSLRKELFSEELTNKLDGLEKKLLLQKSQNEIDLLNEQNKLKAQNLEKAARLKNFLIGFLFLALASCLLIFAILRQRSKHNQDLADKNNVITKALAEKETLLREIHHRVKNNLHFISSLLGLQSQHIDDASALKAIEDGQNRVETMALIHQNLYQEGDLTGVEIKDYFEQLTQQLLDSHDDQKDRIDLRLDIDDFKLDVDTMIPLGLIVHELLVNSLKYAFDGKEKCEIVLNVNKLADQSIQVYIRDNGKGITPDIEKTLGDSFGWRLIKALTKQLRGKIELRNENGLIVDLLVTAK